MSVCVCWGWHSHKKEVPTIVVRIDETGRLYEPHEEGLQTLVVLLESRASDISLGVKTAATNVQYGFKSKLVPFKTGMTQRYH